MSEYETATERREAAATRRRWITLAEVLAVAGVVIAALGLWNSWSDHRSRTAEKAAEQADATQARSRIDLNGTVADGGKSLTIKDPAHELQDATFVFPKDLGIAPQAPVVAPAIDADWISRPLLKRDDVGGDTKAGKLPVLITVRYVDGDAIKSTTGIYDIVWQIEGHSFPFGRALRLHGLRLHERGGSPARLDAIWAKEKPKG